MASNKSDRLGMSYLPQLNSVQPRSGSSTQNNSPTESSTTNGGRGTFGSTGVPSLGNSSNNGPRKGTSSPSHDIGGSRLFSKRAREIQAQEGLSPNVWGPPTSGNSTPLRENIPESPTDGFPDFIPTAPEQSSAPNTPGRARAGTVPSQFSPGRALSSLGLLPVAHPKTSRPTPSTTPFKSHSPVRGDGREGEPIGGNLNQSSLLSRLRSGSLPQRTNFVASSSPFGPSLFSSNWNSGRDRSTTLSSILSSEGPISPTQSTFSKEGPADNELRTLDYLGLADTPQTGQATFAHPHTLASLDAQRFGAIQPFIADMAALNKSANRYRSYSVNATEKYAAEEEDDEEDDLDNGLSQALYRNGSLTPAASIAAAAAATNAEIHRHNLAVQAFAKQASVNRPRSITVGVLESPQSTSMRSYLPPRSRLENSITASELPTDLLESIISMQNGASAVVGKENSNTEGGIDGPTRALWLGSIPASTTVSSLTAIFGAYGTIESARVLTHKNCGFVNFETVDSAAQAKALLNGKEIFPGAGPIRIGYAKVPEASNSGTPGHSGTLTSPSPDPFGKSQEASKANKGGQSNGVDASEASQEPPIPTLEEMKPHILTLSVELGASEQDQHIISQSLNAALSFQSFKPEIPSISEPSHSRVHDAPRLREIRKRIDNNSYSQAEIEDIAQAMLPEIAELSSDYLGNTVVQKLFEFCSEEVKELMLVEVAPHLAEIGVHKNGTWAAQKIIEVARTGTQMALIVEHLRPHIVSLFLDQYGNYVLQCCLRFGAPWNSFIFETMLSRMWEIAQGRFGSRAMRACLESHHSTKEHQRMLAAAIALNSVQLATNTNGALLLTWLLDTCNFNRRRSILAPRLVPHIVQLCTHKVAYLTVLKVINQPKEPEARELVLRALFFTPNDEVLQKILADQTCGITLIFKVLTTPFFDESLRNEVMQNIRNVLTRLKAQPAQGYKRLMDEVGLSTRNGANGSGSRDRSLDTRAAHSPARRAGSQSRNPGAQTPHQAQDRALPGSYFGTNNPPTDPASTMQRNASLDQATLHAFEQFGINNMNNQMYSTNANLPMPQLAPQQLQWQQQQLLLAAQAQAQIQAQASARTIQPPQFYNPFAPTLGGFPAQSPSIDSFRNQPIGSPVQAQMGNGSAMLGQGFNPAQGFNPIVGNQMLQGGFGYPAPAMGGMGFYPPQQNQQQQLNQGLNGGRRGRQR
ncbi:MAG: hypothetical protein M1814_006536 [Vezdaea aestivalis]|nr:MAG: hypothetical protein M1814_006536 [Vezdaea aestivalis]